MGASLETSERAAEAAEQQAAQHKSEGLAKALKLEAWKPASREEELRTWREWYFQLSTYLVAMDPDYAKDLEDVAGEAIIDTDLMDTEGQARSRRLYGFLCNVIKGRPLLLIRGDLEKSRGGLEALRVSA